MKNSILALVCFCSFLSFTANAENSVVVVPLFSEAPSGNAVFASQPPALVQVSTNSVIVSVSMSFPSEGTVVVNASGQSLVATQDFFALPCSININSPTVDFVHVWQTRLQFFGERDFPSQGGFGLPFSGTRGFDVSPGEGTFMLVCSLLQGENVSIANGQITAMFFPSS